MAYLLRRLPLRRSFCSTTRYALTQFSEEENMLKGAVEAFATQEIAPHVLSMDASGQLHPTLLPLLFEQGFLSIQVDPEWGGVGASFMSTCLAIEALSNTDPSIALLADLQNTVICNVMQSHGNDMQCKEWLPQMTSTTIGSFCLSESASGSDAFALQTTAQASSNGEGYTLNGQKMWISNAENADVFLVFATVDKSLGYKGITCFIVKRDTPGLTVGPAEDKIGLRASATCEVRLEEVYVPASDVLGHVGEGYKIAMSTLNEGRIGIAAQMVGLAQGALDRTLPYLFTREQFGQPIGTFQSMQHRYAALSVDITSARLLMYNAARKQEQGLDVMQDASMAKYHAGIVAERTASACIELAGAVGITPAFGVEKYYRDAKVATIYEGTAHMQLNTIAKAMQREFQ